MVALFLISSSVFWDVDGFVPTRTVIPVSLNAVSFPQHSKNNMMVFQTNSQKLQMTTGAVAMEEPNGEGKVDTGKAPMSSLIFNLVKSIVGAGVLSLPAGISAFGNAPSAMLPAAFLIAAIGSLSGYGFSLIGRVCAMTNASSYREAWEKSINKETSIIPAASCTFKTTCAILAYSMILGDTFRSIFSTFGLTVTKAQTIIGMTSTILLPLCLMKNLSSLAPFSLLGIIGMVFTAVSMGIRYFTGAYSFPSGVFLPDIAASLQPNFGSIGAAGVFNPASFILICMLSTAYMSHFNAPKFYNELENNTVSRFNKLVGSSFAISILTFIAMSAFGFLTFGSASSGLILNNYSNKDTLMGLSRIAVAVSLVFSYPLAFAGCRDGVIDLMKVPIDKRSNSLLNKLTVAILSTVTGLALVLKDVSFVLSFGGATLGNALIYVYPALMFRGAVKKMGDKASKGLKSEVKLALANAGDRKSVV